MRSRGTCWTKMQIRRAEARLTSMVFLTSTRAMESTRISTIGTMTMGERSNELAKLSWNEGIIPEPAATGPSAM